MSVVQYLMDNHGEKYFVDCFENYQKLVEPWLKRIVVDVEEWETAFCEGNSVMAEHGGGRGAGFDGKTSYKV